MIAFATNELPLLHHVIVHRHVLLHPPFLPILCRDEVVVALPCVHRDAEAFVVSAVASARNQRVSAVRDLFGDDTASNQSAFTVLSTL